MSKTYLHLIITSVTNDEIPHYEEEQLKEDEAEEEIELVKTKPIETDFLKGINYEDLNSSLGIQLNQMLRKYTLRKIRLEQREKEVSAIYRYIKSNVTDIISVI